MKGVAAMIPRNKCERCGEYDEIPTHQYVKYDEKVNYLCKRCWEIFRAWMLNGNAALNGEKKGRSG
jgi:hypothetical protein